MQRLRLCLRFRLFTAAALAASCPLAACAPTTTYRYSAFVPAVRPIPWDGQTPQKAGTISVDGSLTHTTVRPDLFPQVGDTAVLLPEWTAEGSAMVALSARVQLGVRAAYASYDWAQASASGTMPVPNAQASWGLGPELRTAFPLDAYRRFWLGIAGNVLSYQIPYAEWTLLPGGASGSSVCGPSMTCFSGYSLYDTRVESHLVYSLAVVPTFNVDAGGRYGHVVALVSATNGFQTKAFATAGCTPRRCSIDR
jgi:hypothetical protein